MWVSVSDNIQGLAQLYLSRGLNTEQEHVSSAPKPQILMTNYSRLDINQALSH